MNDETEPTQEQERPRGDLRIRAARTVGVSFPDRTIELVVAPYEETALVEHPSKRNVMIEEVISRGAFDGLQRRANRIRVNRDHERQRVVGRAVAFHPSREEGLVGEVRIARTELGDETLALADEELLDASAAYLPFPGGETWETRNRCRITKAWLGHIALTPDPAYESARVLSVRHRPDGGRTDLSERPVETPHLDALRAAMLAEEFDRRFQ